MDCRWGSLGTGHVSQEKMLQLSYIYIYTYIIWIAGGALLEQVT